MVMIYPINDQIAAFLSEIVDPDTGEISEFYTDEMIAKKLQEIKMEFDDKIVELRNAYKDSMAIAEALKKEKMALGKRQSAEEGNAKRIGKLIGYLLDGKSFKKGTCKIGWRKSEELVLDDHFIEWALNNASEYLRYKDPEPKKDDIKSAIKSGVKFSHCYLQPKQNIQVK